jgi:hypothetical protein
MPLPFFACDLSYPPAPQGDGGFLRSRPGREIGSARAELNQALRNYMCSPSFTQELHGVYTPAVHIKPCVFKALA